jgi:DNA-binding transcriptional ArsR family regulator
MLSCVPVLAGSDLSLQAQLLHGLSDPSRLAILAALRAGERRPTDLAEETGLSQPNVSKHLACLWGCGLLAREKRGREVFYETVDGIDELLASVDQVLERAGDTVGTCALTAETLHGGRE